jgi:hypothetical protein
LKLIASFFHFNFSADFTKVVRVDQVISQEVVTAATILEVSTQITVIRATTNPRTTFKVEVVRGNDLRAPAQAIIQIGERRVTVIIEGTLITGGLRTSSPYTILYDLNETAGSNFETKTL